MENVRSIMLVVRLMSEESKNINNSWFVIEKPENM
jgi:hypothetical protein